MWNYFVGVDTNEKEECVPFKVLPLDEFLNSWLVPELRATLFHHSYSLETSVDVQLLTISLVQKKKRKKKKKLKSSGETPEKLFFRGLNATRPDMTGSEFNSSKLDLRGRDTE